MKRKFILLLAPILFVYGVRAQPTVDGDLSDSDYLTIATKQNTNSSFGSAIDATEIVYYPDDANSTLYIGVKGKLEVNNDNGIGLMLNFPELNGVDSGTTLGFPGAGHFMDGQGSGSNDDFKADFEVDYMLAMNPGNGNTNVFYDLAKLVGGSNTGQFMGSSDLTGGGTSIDGNFNIFSNSISFVFNNGGGTDQGFEMSIPYSDLGITTAGGLEAFAFVVSNTGFFSDVTVPGNLSDQGNFNADFSASSNGPYSDSKEFLTTATGNFSAMGTWADNIVPPGGANITIDHDVTLNQDATVTSVAISTGKTLTSEASQGRTLTVNNGGSFTNNGTFTANDGTVSFAGAATVSGTKDVTFNNVDYEGGVDFGAGGTGSTINGTATVNGGGFVNTNPPAYGNSSTLLYNINGTYRRDSEWTPGATSGAGYPNNVQLTNNTVLELGANSATGNSFECAGDFTVDAGSSLDMNNPAMTEALTVKGDFVNNGTVTLSTSFGGDLKLEGDFDDNGTFTANARAVFFDGATKQTVSSTGTLEFDYVEVSAIDRVVEFTQNITVNNDFNIKSNASAASSVLVQGGITNNDTITIEDNASLVQTGTGNSGTGTYKVTRDAGTADNHAVYQYWSSPLQGLTMGNAFPNSNTNDFYTWDESTSGNGNSSWSQVASNTTMAPGRGYATTPDQTGSNTSIPVNLTFSGTNINNGNIDVSLNSPDNDDYLLLGNPYPSAIDNATFLTDNPKLLGTIYYWNQTTQTFGGSGWSNSNDDGEYATWTNAGGVSANGAVTPNAYTQSMQGFFVQLDDQQVPPPIQISFNNAQRVSGNNDQFFKRNRQEKRQRVWLNAVNDSGAFNQILVALTPQTTAQYDKGWDGEKLKGNPNIAFYSILGQKDLAIQALDQDLKDDKVIPLGLDAGQTGRYTIGLDSLDNWPGHTLALLDSAQGTVTDLSQNDYQFAVNQTGSIRGRFYLLISSDPFAGVGLEEAQSGELLYFQRGDALVVDSRLQSSPLEQVILRSVSGRILRQAAPGTLRHELTVGDLPQGVYLLEAQNRAGETTHHKVYLR